MQVLSPHAPPIRWLAAGIMIGAAMAHLGLLGSLLILVGLALVAHCRGYRITLSKNETSDDHM